MASGFETVHQPTSNLSPEPAYETVVASDDPTSSFAAVAHEGHRFRRAAAPLAIAARTAPGLMAPLVLVGALVVFRHAQIRCGPMATNG